MADADAHDGRSAPDSTVSVELDDDGVATLFFDRPKRLNAINLDLILDATRALRALGDDDGCRAVVITGRGRAFSAGGDLASFEVLNPATSSVPRMRLYFDRANELLQQIQATPKPVIAAVNGPAMGGGLALALAADTRICTESATFSVAFVKLGLAGAEWGVSWLLPRIVGPTAAFELCYSGRTFDAAEAERLRLVLEAVPDAELLDRARTLARSFIANSPIGLATTKDMLYRHLGATNYAEAVDTEASAQMLCSHTADHREAFQAFTERRPPTFQNR